MVARPGPRPLKGGTAQVPKRHEAMARYPPYLVTFNLRNFGK